MNSKKDLFDLATKNLRFTAYDTCLILCVDTELAPSTEMFDKALHTITLHKGDKVLMGRVVPNNDPLGPDDFISCLMEKPQCLTVWEYCDKGYRPIAKMYVEPGQYLGLQVHRRSKI